MSELLTDLVSRFNAVIENSNKLNAMLYERLQRIESDKTPGNWRPYTINLLCFTSPLPQAIQVLRKEPRRNTAAVYNQGPDDALISNVQFDPTSILQQLSDAANPDTILPAPNQVVEIGLLTSGSTINIEATEGMWAYNLSTSGAVLSIIENLYRSVGTLGRPTANGLDGLVHQGYLDNGAKTLI